MAEFWAIKWIGYVIASYLVVGFCLAALIGWVVLTYKARKRTLARLEMQGLKRASSHE